MERYNIAWYVSPETPLKGIAMRDWLALGMVVALSGTAMAAERRELAPHEHGRSKLNLAVEGGQVVMEIEAPGMDLVGFEYPAQSDEEKAKVKAAQSALATPLELFVIPEAAGCKQVKTAVELLQEEHEDADEEEQPGQAAAAGEHHGKEIHNEFRGHYTLDCANPGALNQITFVWFDRYPNAKKVDVTLVNAKGQTLYQVERGDPPLTIGAQS